uniref:40S ribosomal protein S15 n=1 Tax=Caenorhabditis tropicalis TaxID=1561998 RepID=A0A1I7UVM3_9PELO
MIEENNDEEEELNYDERLRFVTINELDEVCEMGTFKDRFEKVSLFVTYVGGFGVGSGRRTRGKTWS